MCQSIDELLSSMKSSNFIYFAAFVSNIISFEVGTSISWTSPVLPKLQSSNSSINPLSTPITILEESLIASSLGLASILTTIIAGLLCEKLGKKRSMLILTVPMVGGHLLSLFASHVYMFIAARFLMGLTAGGVFAILPGYLSEIAEVSNRGVLCSMFCVALAVGVTFVYMVAPLLSIKMFSLVNLAVTILYLLLFKTIVPESPFDLFRRGQSEQAMKALTKLRRKPAHHLTKEFHIISETYLPSKKRCWMVLLEGKALKKAFLISVVLIIMHQFTGVSAITAYMQSIFEASGSSIPPVYASMLISIFQMCASLLGSFLVDRAGRRPLLITSTISCILSLATLAGYFQLKASGKDLTPYGWLPLATMFIFAMVFSLGLGNIPWIMPSELFPPNVRAISLSVTTFANLSLSFIVTMFFPAVSEWLGMAGSFFIFMAVLCVGLVFIVIMVPETKGRSCKEIQRLLEGGEGEV